MGRRRAKEKALPPLEYMSDVGYEPAPPSILPLILAGGILLTAIGAMVAWVRIIALGIAVVVFGAIGMGFELPGYGEEARGQRGIMRGVIDNRKLGITTFIGAESLFLSTLAAAYLIYKKHECYRIARGARDTSIPNGDCHLYLADEQLHHGARDRSA